MSGAGSSPLLTARGLTKRFAARRGFTGKILTEIRAVDGVDLTLFAGKTLALVGESGCGKSTLGRLLLRLIEPSSGELAFDGEDLLALDAKSLRQKRRQAQLIFQDPFASLNPRMTIGEAIGEPLLLHDLVPPAKRAERIAELLIKVGLRADHKDRYPHEFSGGQRQRIVIARALAGEPKLIVCDEPVSALDVSIRAQILNLLRDLQQEFGLCLVFISHDLAVVHHIADEIAVMYLGRIVEQGPAARIFASPRHPYTRALLSAIPIAAPKQPRGRIILAGDIPSPIDPPPGCHLHRRCPYAAPACQQSRPELSRDGQDTHGQGHDGQNHDGQKHAVACHEWRNLPEPQSILLREAAPDPLREKLIAAFATPLPAGPQAEPLP